MNRVIMFLLICISIIASLVLVSTAVGQDGTTDISSLIDNAESVESALKVESETTLQYITGAVLGAGIGVLLGSTAVYEYWRRNIG